MHKVAKLTWLHNGNYGTVLQAFALQKFITLNGYEVVDIDYKANVKTKLANLFCNGNSLKLFIGKFKEARGRRSYPHPELFKIREEKFCSFMKKNMILSRQFHTPKELKEIIDSYDVYVCGSDQIWSPYLMNPVFYLDFLPSGKKRISYATSFGVTSTTKIKENKIRNFLNRFDYISVRELQGQKFVNRLINRDVPVCIDPTLLITIQEWEQYTKNRIVDEKYIFVYLLTPNDEYIQAVKKFAECKNLPVVIVPTMQGPFDTNFIEKVDAGPEDWLSLIKNAEYVFTDSFHGSIFSLIFKKEFFLLKRFNDNDKVSQNSRIYTLTTLLGIQDRIIDRDSIDRIYYLEDLNYVSINKLIRGEADISGKWLLKALSECV